MPNFVQVGWSGTGCIECLALGSAWLPMVLVSSPRVWLCWLASWLLVELLRVRHLLQLWLNSGFGKGWSGVTDLQQDAVAVAFLGYA